MSQTLSSTGTRTSSMLYIKFDLVTDALLRTEVDDDTTKRMVDDGWWI